jgi:hypothetical protein
MDEIGDAWPQPPSFDPEALDGRQGPRAFDDQFSYNNASWDANLINAAG